MLVKDENDYAILRRAEDMLDTTFDWNTKDDDMTGIVREDPFVIIDNLCSEIDRLQEKLDEQKEYYENQIKDFYTPKSPYEIFEVDENAFH